jgi:hypothetical protein
VVTVTYIHGSSKESHIHTQVSVGISHIWDHTGCTEAVSVVKFIECLSHEGL